MRGLESSEPYFLIIEIAYGNLKSGMIVSFPF
jgi:hypothetical protein